MTDWSSELNFFRAIRIRIDISADISTFCKTYDNQILQAGTFIRVDPLATNEASASDVIPLKPHDFENLL